MLSDDDKAHIVNRLDSGYCRRESLQQFVQEMVNAGISREDRNAIILESDYGRDEKIRSTIVLFGGGG